jgi:hypothetical protein
VALCKVAAKCLVRAVCTSELICSRRLVHAITRSDWWNISRGCKPCCDFSGSLLLTATVTPCARQLLYVTAAHNMCFNDELLSKLLHQRVILVSDSLGIISALYKQFLD